VHGGRRRNALRPALGEEIHRLARDRLAERKLAGVEIGEELAKRPRIHHRTREAVLAERARLFQHGDVELGPAAGGLLLPGEAGQLDGAGEPRRPRSDDHHVHLDRLGTRRVPPDELVEGKRALVTKRKDGGHGGRLPAGEAKGKRRKYNSALPAAVERYVDRMDMAKAVRDP
jgi:hypothetical protein